MSTTRAPGAVGRATGGVLLTLAAGQFLMTPDSSVMNVAIATVAKEVGSTVTGIQTSPGVTAAALDINSAARVDGLRSALAVLALVALFGLLVARRIPRRYSPQTGDPP